MKLSKKSRQTARKFFQASLVQGRIDSDRVRSITKLVVERKPRDYLGLLKEFHRLLRLETAKSQATIESATPLSPETLATISRDLQSRHNGMLIIESKVNPALIGGLRLQIGSEVCDGSVRERLRLLEKQFAA